MPLLYQQDINESTKIAVWHILEDENFFLKKVISQREIKHPHKRLQHLAARFLLKELFPDFPNELIKIADTRKPFLEDEKYHFSISHCGNYAAVIVSRESRVGIDIEVISVKAEKVKHKFLSESEEIMITQNAQMNQIQFFDPVYTLCWSIKESLYKWNGEEGIDFIKNLIISDIQTDETGLSGISPCTIQKSNSVSLTVDFKFLNEISLAWCIK
jgi:phosphopantetheinyl transferase